MSCGWVSHSILHDHMQATSNYCSVQKNNIHPLRHSTGDFIRLGTHAIHARTHARPASNKRAPQHTATVGRLTAAAAADHSSAHPHPSSTSMHRLPVNCLQQRRRSARIQPNHDIEHVYVGIFILQLRQSSPTKHSEVIWYVINTQINQTLHPYNRFTGIVKVTLC